MKRAAIALLLLLGLASAPAPAVIDPFYRNRMDSGLRAFDQGNWEAAEHQLRIACFGYLDEPVALVEGLIRLAIVKVNLGDEDGFRRIFSRLAELEERFSAYGAAEVPDSVRRQFESRAARLVPLQGLRSVAAFQAIAELADIQRLAAMPPDQRRAALESKIQSEPDRADWVVEMVRLELAVRRPQAALDWLDRLPAETAGRPPATCLRQQAASESDSCERVDLSQPFCRDVPPDVVEFRLGCLVEADRWPEAAALLAGLSPELRARRRVARLDRRVQNNLGPAVEVVPEPLPSTEPTAVVVPAVPAPAAPNPREAPTAAVPEALSPELSQLRARLAAAATAAELAAIRTDADLLADRFPDSRQARLLAAEIAYLQADWRAAARQFALAGELRADEAHLAFYRAVALYESGDRDAAASVLRPVVSRLERTEFVTVYLDRILAP